jgi:RNA polymerase primary sigma factor
LTLTEVGQAFDLTRERIRQIESHALAKLEALPETQTLKEAT